MVELDQNIFLFLNSHHSLFFDKVMWILSMRKVWIPLYLAIIWIIISKYGKSAWTPMLMIPLLVLIDDQGSLFLKNLTERPRPCHEPDLAGMVHTVRGHYGGMYGFVSGHAANSFGIAAFSASLIQNRWYTWCIFIWAALLSYSRVYLGVHYPGDIIGGAILGLLAGFGLAWAAKKINQRIKQ